MRRFLELWRTKWKEEMQWSLNWIIDGINSRASRHYEISRQPRKAHTAFRLLVY